MAQHNWTILNFSFFLTLFSAHDLQMINIDNRMDNWKWYHFVQNWTFPLFTNMYPENPPRPLESLLLNREMGAFIFCRVLIIRIRIIFSFQSFSLATFSLLSLVDTFPGFNLPDTRLLALFCQMILLFVTKRKTYCNLARLVVPLSG